MTGRSKIQDARELQRWFREGRTYKWMVEEYERKYNMHVSSSMFSSYRSRNGLERRIARNDDLIPWAVKAEHRWAYPLVMLRVESRLRAGLKLRPIDAVRLDSFKQSLYADGAVVHYDPDTEQGWFLVPRREGVDLDLIRNPPRKTTTRKNADSG